VFTTIVESVLLMQAADTAMLVDEPTLIVASVNETVPLEVICTPFKNKTPFNANVPTKKIPVCQKRKCESEFEHRLPLLQVDV
jgi:hypothetical protein